MDKYLQEETTPAELQELSWWLQSGLCEEELEEMIEKTWLSEKATIAAISETNQREDLLRKILAAKVEQPVPSGRIVSFKRYWWLAAACLLVIASVFLLNRVGTNERTNTPLATADTAEPKIVPGSFKAVLTLEDGSEIALDDQLKGRIANQGNATVFKQDSGLLGYQGQSGVLAYNTLRTPRGGEYQVVLNDGSRVWLNASTSLRFPVSFTASQRVVELDGEAYFEIAHDAGKPFFVKMKDGTSVEVTGTHFNVMAYDDEDWHRTTLLEGSIAVRKNGLFRQVKPGQQAAVTGNEIVVTSMNDPEESIAWKNGLLSFHDADIKTIMRQAARWYDVKVLYKSEMPERIFTGSVNRSSSLKELLKIFELSDIHFTFQGRTILVSG